VLLHFLLTFPEPSPVVRRWPWLERAIYWPTVAVMLVAAPVFWLFFTDPDRAWAIARGEKWFSGLAGGLWLSSTLLGLLALVTSYRQANLSSRRRLRVAVVGTVAGFLPLLALISAGSFFDLSRVPLWLLRGLGLLATLALALVPLSFGYAILRHQVIPLRVMLRRGLRYLLVSRGVVVLEVVAVVGLVAFLLTGPRGALVDALGPRADIVIALVVGVLGLVGLHRVNRRLRTAIDRRFFREAYDARQLLTGLSEAVREVPNAGALVDLVAGRVNAALRPENVRLFIRDDDDDSFPLAHPRPSAGGIAPRWLVERLAGMDQAVTVEGHEPDLEGMAPAAGTSAGPVLCLAMRGKRELMGILALGRRLSEVPYSREDRQLLHSVASQAGLSLENSVLIRRVAEQERVAHELEIASEVQRRLFPDRAPRCRTLDLAGLCVPAGDVGGDYYDFLELGEGRVGFAVADVAGKGLPAALLMSMVQASLRSQAGGGRPIVGLCASMNELLYRSTAPNAYATFFYGVFDEDSRRLAYVNAGHNPPLVIRAAGPGTNAEESRWGRTAADVQSGAALATAAVASAPERDPVHRLAATGLVLGALAESLYLEETLVLEAGDVVVAYTDGVSEAFNPRGEEFGEERLAAVVAEGRDLSAARLVEHVAAAVESWRGQSPAHDDFTLVVARVL
jgi:phosphoserine phosphatase RsbU/P